MQEVQVRPEKRDYALIVSMSTWVLSASSCAGDMVVEPDMAEVTELPGFSADESLDPASTLHLDNGHLLELHAAGPDSLGIAEPGRAGEPPMISAMPEVLDMQLSDIDELLLSEPVPWEILDADAAGAAATDADGDVPELAVADVQPDDDTELQMALPDDDDASPAQACPKNQFLNRYCSVAADYEWDACLTNQRANLQRTRNGQRECYTVACSDIGTVTLYVTTNKNAGGEWTLRPGQRRVFRWRANDLDFTAGVRNVTPGDRYHFTMGCSN